MDMVLTSKSMRTDSVARFTVALVTPVIFLRFFSTLVTHAAQVMPATGRF